MYEVWGVLRLNGNPNGKYSTFIVFSKTALFPSYVNQRTIRTELRDILNPFRQVNYRFISE